MEILNNLSNNAAVVILTVTLTAIMCYLPMKNQLRFEKIWIMVIFTVILVVMILTNAYLDRALPGAHKGFVSACFFVLLFLGYCFTLKAPFLQSFAIFVHVSSMSFIPRLLACAISSEISSRTGIWSVFSSYNFLHLLLSVAMFVFFYIVINRSCTYIVDHLKTRWKWYLTGSISLLSFILMLLIQEDIELGVQSNSGHLLYLMQALTLSASYLFFVYYSFNVSYSLLAEESRKMQEDVYLLQKVQYEEMQHHMEDMRIINHDMRHTYRMIMEMAEKEDYQGIQDYLSQSVESIPQTPVRKYCEDTMVNAVLDYYSRVEKRYAVETLWKIDIPANVITQQAADLAKLLGNLLENAVQGCCTMPLDKRTHELTVLTVNKTNLYIVSTNTFDGRVRLSSRGRYRSTRDGGSGLGLESMSRVVQEYSGTMEVYNDEKRFYVDIVMKLNCN